MIPKDVKAFAEAKQATVVTADGKVLLVHPEPKLLLIVESYSFRPVLKVSEVSDDNTVNLFLDIPKGVGFIDNREDMSMAATPFEVLGDREDVAFAWESQHPK